MKRALLLTFLVGVYACVDQGNAPELDQQAKYSNGSLISDLSCDDTSPVLLDTHMYWLQTCSGTTTLKHATLNSDLTFEASTTTIDPTTACGQPIGTYASGDNYVTGLVHKIGSTKHYFLAFVYNSGSYQVCLAKISSDGQTASVDQFAGGADFVSLTSEIIGIAVDVTDDQGGDGASDAESNHPLFVFTRSGTEIDKTEYHYNYGSSYFETTAGDFDAIRFDNGRYPNRIAYFDIPYDLGAQNFLILPAITIENGLGLINPEVFANDSNSGSTLVKPGSTGIARLNDISSGGDKDPWCDEDGRVYFSSTRAGNGKYDLFRVNSPTVQQRVDKILQFLGL